MRMFCVLLTFLLHSAESASEDLLLSFKFTRNPPLAGVIYSPNTHANVPLKGILDQNKKLFLTPIVISSPNGGVEFRNSDSINHNVYVNDIKNGVRLDVGLMEPGDVVDGKSIRLPDGVLIRVGCKIHPKMKAYLLSLDSDYIRAIKFTKGEARKSITLAKLPEDRTLFHLKLPKYDEVSFDLKTDQGKEIPLMRSNKIRGTFTVGRLGDTP